MVHTASSIGNPGSIGPQPSAAGAADGIDRPQALPLIPENVPVELTAVPQWVVWQYVEDVDTETGEVDWDKPPVRALTGGLASSTKEKTWSTWEQALAAYQRGGLDGVGFVLNRDKNAEGPGLVGIDLDHCRDPRTGVIAPWARRIIDSINSYSEVSPSGGGVRMFIYGQPPATGRKKRGDYENYATGRYVTVTGQHIEGTPLTVEHRQAELEAVQKGIWGDPRPERPPSGGGGLPTDLIDLDIVERASRAKKVGPKFSRLWSGDAAGYGSKSEADLALCNYLAFWCGPDEERIADLFAQSGLFRGKWQREDYRKRTIGLALAGRTAYYDWSRAQVRIRRDRDNGRSVNGAGQNGQGDAEPPDGTEQQGSGQEHPSDRFWNYAVVEEGEGDAKVKYKVGLAADAMWQRLHQRTGGWPKRVGSVLFAEGPEHKPLWLLNTDNSFAWIGRQLTEQALHPICWLRGNDKVSQSQFFAYLTQAAEAFDAVESYPHYPPRPRHYYMHPPPKGGDGKSLERLLRRFCPATVVDRDLIAAFFFTLFWGGSPGQRPAFLVESEDDDPAGGRGVGKTKLIQAGAHLVGGHIDVNPKEDSDKMMTRLLSPAAMDRRVALLDNIKTLKFSWAELESLITCDVISGRQLYVGEGRRPNTLVWCLTLNGATLSKDMAQRCAILRLKRSRYDPSWESGTWDYIDSHRWEIIGDILAELQKPAPMLKRYSRWSAWEQQVLARVGDPTECQKVLTERQGAVDGDQEEADLVRQALVELLQRWRHDHERAVVWVSAHDAAEAVCKATNEQRPVPKVTAYLRTLTIPELRKCDRGDWGKGWTWTGKKAPFGATVKSLREDDGPV